MADVDHPKTHVEDDKDVKLPRKQPESPHREGIDPLTEGDTMYPAENTKSASERLSKKEAEAERDTTADEQVATTVADQEELNARSATPNEKLSDDTKTATSEQQASNEDKGGAKNGEVTSAAKSDNSPKTTKNAKDSEGDQLPQTAKPTNPSVNDGNSEKGDRK